MPLRSRRRNGGGHVRRNRPTRPRVQQPPLPTRRPVEPTTPAPVVAPPTPTLDEVGTTTTPPTTTATAPTTVTAGLGENRPETAGTLQTVYDENRASIEAMSEDPSALHASSREQFLTSWEANRERYEAVAADAGIPAELVAALHWRESSGNFGTYMHQGDPLGSPAVNWPTNIPVFHEWEASASHALGRFSGLQEDLDIGADTTDMAALATFAEHYNGLGYHNRGVVSPYVMAGTDQYTGGKYVRDGVYDPNHVDQQPGVVFLMQGIRDAEAARAAEGGE